MKSTTVLLAALVLLSTAGWAQRRGEDMRRQSGPTRDPVPPAAPAPPPGRDRGDRSSRDAAVTPQPPRAPVTNPQPVAPSRPVEPPRPVAPPPAPPVFVPDLPQVEVPDPIQVYVPYPDPTYVPEPPPDWNVPAPPMDIIDSDGIPSIPGEGYAAISESQWDPQNGGFDFSDGSVLHGRRPSSDISFVYREGKCIFNVSVYGAIVDLGSSDGLRIAALPSAPEWSRPHLAQVAWHHLYFVRTADEERVFLFVRQVSPGDVSFSWRMVPSWQTIAGDLD